MRGEQASAPGAPGADMGEVVTDPGLACEAVGVDARNLRLLHVDPSAAGNEFEWVQNIRYAQSLGYPELVMAPDVRDDVVVIVASGPSVQAFLDQLVADYDAGRQIWAVKGAHDWLIEHGIVPDVYTCLDPRDRTENIRHHNGHTEYLLASRCPPVMFDYLSGRKITVWNSFEEESETWPEFRGRMVVYGGTTTGLRTIQLAWARGFRKFKVYGMDSCLAVDRKTKRVTGEQAPSCMDLVYADRVYWTTPAMAQQAMDFKNDYVRHLYPGVEMEFVGEGVLGHIWKVETDALKAGAQPAVHLRTSQQRSVKDRPSISFLHPGDETMASYRYRAQIPALELQKLGYDARVNAGDPDILILAKPCQDSLAQMDAAQGAGIKVIVDICDPHFQDAEMGAVYIELCRRADLVTAPTDTMSDIIYTETGRNATVIGDPIEGQRCEPHAQGDRVLWFGHGSNLDVLWRYFPHMHKVTDRFWICTTTDLLIPHVPWSRENLERELRASHICMFPTKKEHAYKSPNRLCEALAAGCWPVVEPHPAYEPWRHLVPPGSCLQGIRHAISHPEVVNEWVESAQEIAFRLYGRDKIARLWADAVDKLISCDIGGVAA